MFKKNIGIIPTRLNSSRFPSKLLVPIMGKSLLQRTYENAQRSQTLSELIVATYDEKIYEHVLSFNGQAVMTDPNCLNGSDCIAAALQAYPHLMDAEVIVNVQGDEPCLDPACIDQAVQLLLNDPLAMMATVVTPLKTKEEAESSSIVKCVMDRQQNALYFSRSLIPSNKNYLFNPSTSYFRHIGLYVYRPEFLLTYRALPATPLQMEEDLEQLKVIEHGYRIKVAIVEHDSIGVDVPEDIKKVEKWLCKQNTYS